VYKRQVQSPVAHWPHAASVHRDFQAVFWRVAVLSLISGSDLS